MGEMRDKLEGKLREVKGAATGDAGEELRGKAQQTKGNVEGALNETRARAEASAEAGSDAETTVEETETRDVAGDTTVTRRTYRSER